MQQQAVTWMNEEQQNYLFRRKLMRSRHFLDGGQLKLAVSISVIGYRFITPIEMIDLWLDAAVFGAVWFHIHLGSAVRGQMR